MPERETLFNEAFLRKLETLTLAMYQARAGRMQGERRSTKRGQSVEFADYRSYAPGDDFRLVDWNAFARLERFFIKLFVEEEDVTVHLLLDTSPSMDWPPLEDIPTGETHKLSFARRAAAALGYIALAGFDRVVPVPLGSTFNAPAALRGKQQAFRLFDHLLTAPGESPFDLNQALLTYAARARHPGPLLLFSDLFAPPHAAAEPFWGPGMLALLGRRFDVTIVHLLSPDEVEPTLAGDLRLRDVEHDQPVELTADFEALSRYRSGLQAWQRDLQAWCHKRGVRYVFVPTDIPFEDLVFTFLRHRGILQ